VPGAPFGSVNIFWRIRTVSEGAKGAALVRRACAMGLEGIVSKRIDTPYRSGPFLGWRKIKCPGYARP
jgi:ATP-dependent DNA ligase